MCIFVEKISGEFSKRITLDLLGKRKKGTHIFVKKKNKAAFSSYFLCPSFLIPISRTEREGRGRQTANKMRMGREGGELNVQNNRKKNKQNK